MPFLQCPWGVLHYRVIGDINKLPAIVFSNSLGTDSRIWEGVVAQLEGAYACILYDKRGHGLSDAPEAPYQIDDHIDDLNRLLDHLKVGSVVICGLSIGGMIAQGFYERFSDRVRGLILCDTGHKIGEKTLWNERIETITRQGIASIADAVLERWFSAAYRAANKADLAGYRNMLTRTPTAGYVGSCAALRDGDYTQTAPQISCPCLCVVGAQDQATPPDLVHSLAGLIPGARYLEIPESGHLPCIEQPEVLARVLCEFMTQVK